MISFTKSQTVVRLRLENKTSGYTCCMPENNLEFMLRVRRRKKNWILEFENLFNFTCHQNCHKLLLFSVICHTNKVNSNIQSYIPKKNPNQQPANQPTNHHHHHHLNLHHAIIVMKARNILNKVTYTPLCTYRIFNI